MCLKKHLAKKSQQSLLSFAALLVEYRQRVFEEKQKEKRLGNGARASWCVA